MKKLFLVLFALPFAACTKQENTTIYQSPPADILKSFSTDCSKKNCIKLEKADLNKTYLLIISGKTNEATPTWMDLKPAVVVFQKTASQVGLFSLNLDSIYGRSDSKELIQSFDIIDEDTTSVTFNWGQGLETLREESPFDIEVKDPHAVRGSIRVMSSFVNRVAVSSQLIEILQISKVQNTRLASRPENPFDQSSKVKEQLETTEATFNLSIQLLPYTENKNFQPKLANTSRTVGFFVTTSGTPAYARKAKNLIMKWDLRGDKGPVRFLISATTPAEYVDAVREGILYWNHVLGFEAVKVETGIDDSSVPPIHAVMVRWTPWEDAGFAYAQLQADPLTGEALRGQVFMTPAWLHSKGIGEKLSPILNPMSACDFGLSSMEKPLDYPDNPLDLRIAQDRVRGVIAHEVGHALGLRHNFAGSSSVSISAKEVLQKIKGYLIDDTHPGAMTASTVMDYTKGADEILLGKYILNHPLPYDQMALKWAYAAGDKDLSPAVSNYCSDEDIELALSGKKVEIYDCRRHDATGSQFISLIDAQLKVRRQLLQSKYAEILNVLFPSDEPQVVNSLSRLLEDHHPDLQLKGLKDQFSFYQSHEKVVSLDKWRNELQRKFTTDKDPALDQILRDHLEEAGGMVKVKELLTPKTSGWTQTELRLVLDAVAVGEGLTKSGRAYKLTAAQQSQFAAYFKDEAQYVEAQLQKELNEMFKGL